MVIILFKKGQTLKYITIKLKEDTIKKLAIIAEQDRRTRAAVCRMILEDAVESILKKNQCKDG